MLVLFECTICIKTMFGSLYLQLLVGNPMSYLLYLCLLAYSGVQHILRCVLLLLFSFRFFSSSASFSGFSIVDCPFDII